MVDFGVVGVRLCLTPTYACYKPLYFAHNNEGAEHEGSRLVVLISAHMQDWLQKRDIGEIVEGSKKWKDVETVWTFRMRDGVWKVASIEERHLAIQYARMMRRLPGVEGIVKEMT